MFSLLLSISLAADPAANEWEKAESAHLKNIKQLTFDFVRRRRLFLARRQEDHLPGRGKGHRQSVLPDLHPWTWRRAAIAASAPASARRPAASSAPTARRSSSPAATSIPTPKSTRPRSTSSARRTRKSGVRRRYSWDFDPHMEIFEANPDGSDLKRLTERQGLRRRGQLLARRQADRLLLEPATDNLELYIMDADGKNVRQLTKHRAATTAARSSRRTARRSSSAAIARRRTICNSTSSTPTAPASRR